MVVNAKFWSSASCFCDQRLDGAPALVHLGELCRRACALCTSNRAGKSYAIVHSDIRDSTVFYTIIRCFTRFTPYNILFDRIVAFQNHVFGQP
jgi:hypothetical protein